MKTINSNIIGFGLAAILIAGVTGCGQEQNGNAQPAPSDATETSAGEDSSTDTENGNPSVPTVTNPKDSTGLEPCEFLTPQDLESLELAPATGQEETVGLEFQGCRWRSPDSGLTVAAYIDESDIAFSELYSQQSEFEVFEEIEIAGHPAVRASRVESQFSCEVLLALADDQLLVASADIGERSDLVPCDWTEETASTIVANFA